MTWFRKKKPLIAVSTLDELRTMLNGATSAVSGSTPVYFGIMDSADVLHKEVFILDRVHLAATHSGTRVEIYIKTSSVNAN